MMHFYTFITGLPILAIMIAIAYTLNRDQVRRRSLDKEDYSEYRGCILWGSVLVVAGVAFWHWHSGEIAYAMSNILLDNGDIRAYIIMVLRKELPIAIVIQMFLIGLGSHSLFFGFYCLRYIHKDPILKPKDNTGFFEWLDNQARIISSTSLALSGWVGLFLAINKGRSARGFVILGSLLFLSLACFLARNWVRRRMDVAK